MKRITFAVSAVCACLALTAPAASDPRPKDCTADQFRTVAQQLHHPWYQPVSNRWRMRRLLGCAQNARTFKAMKRIRENQEAGKAAAVEHYYVLTPYPGCGQVGRSAIPTYIVYRESRCTWNAYNPSGASGPYQLLGWGAPMPVYGMDQKMAHHKIAHDLWAGGAGCSNWSAC